MPQKKIKEGRKLFVIACDDYINEVMSLNKYGSYRQNRRIAKKLILEFGHKNVDQISKQDIQRYIVKMSMKVSPPTLRHYLSVFKGIMEYADEDWVMPRLKIPKAGKPRQEFYTFEEVRELLLHSSGQDKLLIMFLAETGCRVGEALALQQSDVRSNLIDINKNVYEGVVQSTPKTTSSIRKVSISTRLYNSLKNVRGRETDYIFRSPTGRPAWPQQLTESLREICSKAGLDWKGFHAFRRGNVTELVINLQMPVNIVGFRVGHETGGVTLGVYVQVREGCDKPYVERIEKLLYGCDESQDVCL